MTFWHSIHRTRVTASLAVFALALGCQALFARRAHAKGIPGEGSIAVTEWQWFALNRLAEVRDGAGELIARYTYDPFDRRIGKELGASTTLQSQGLAAGAVAHYLPGPWGLLDARQVASRCLLSQVHK